MNGTENSKRENKNDKFRDIKIMYVDMVLIDKKGLRSNRRRKEKKKEIEKSMEKVSKRSCRRRGEE